jgi:hypothetical protein
VNDTLDDLELELRRLPGVISVAVSDEDGLRVHLCVTSWADATAVRQRAELLALSHDEAPTLTVSRAGEGLTVEDESA